jgi:hypothetical protein
MPQMEDNQFVITQGGENPETTKILSALRDEIDGWEQVFSIQVGGTITIQKFGRSVTRTTSNVITTN